MSSPRLSAGHLECFKSAAHLLKKTATFTTRSKPDYKIICKAQRNVKQLNKVAKKRWSEICEGRVGGWQR